MYVIIGGGIIGLSLAYELSCRGLRVTLVERGEPGREASWAGAGILPPTGPRAADPLDQLRAHSCGLHAEWAERLREETGIDTGYRRNGGLMLAVGDKEERGQARSIAAWHAEGVEAEFLDRAALAEREPALAAHVRAACLLGEMAQLRNPRHLAALVAACMRRGVTIRCGTPVVGFAGEGRCTAVVTAGGERIAGDGFVVAAGPWSRALLEAAGVRAAMRPIRGQIALLNAARPPLRHILMHGKRYVVPRPDGRILVGSTEEDAGFDKRTTATAISDLLQFALSVVPALGEAAIERCWAGLRPGSDRGRPYLGSVPGWENVYVAAGHFRSGLHLSTGTAVLMRQLLLGEPPIVDPAPFRVEG